MVTLEIAVLKDVRELEDLIFSGSEFQRRITAGKERLVMSIYIRLRNKVVMKMHWSTEWNEIFVGGGWDRQCCFEF